MAVFSKSVVKNLGRELRQDIMDALLGDNMLKKDINKVLQQANRRIQNINNKGYASPALKAVYAERGTSDRYTVFSISGLDLKNQADWERAKYEYSRAMAFLNNPTSSATGARQYIEHQARELNIPFDSANRLVDMATSPQISENGTVNIFSYGSILDAFKSDVEQYGDSMATDSEEYAKELEGMLQQVIDESTQQFQNVLNSFLGGVKW